VLQSKFSIALDLPDKFNCRLLKGIGLLISIAPRLACLSLNKEIGLPKSEESGMNQDLNAGNDGFLRSVNGIYIPATFQRVSDSYKKYFR
jgi:hypothetical protein